MREGGVTAAINLLTGTSPALTVATGVVAVMQCRSLKAELYLQEAMSQELHVSNPFTGGQIPKRGSWQNHALALGRLSAFCFGCPVELYLVCTLHHKGNFKLELCSQVLCMTPFTLTQGREMHALQSCCTAYTKQHTIQEGW